ncbi:DinB family protein [Actinopolymorpha sp. B17G11]|uniref:DinB family protein n=1 Tax=Actinopolymorpha sp. B17G11 TaxID=3160861 RepID=UPI0032E47EE1
MERAPEPGDVAERDLLVGWLAFHRDALAAKCDGLGDGDLVIASAPPSDLSLLGLVRHMTEMEHAYLAFALGGADDGPFRLIYCTDDAPDGDIVGLTPAMTRPSLDRWHEERRRVDNLLAGVASFDATSPGNGRAVRWNLLKVIQEYARHNGHADLIRERIDGTTGE